MRYQGKIVEWNDTRGFGFVVPLDGGERVFLHVSALPKGSRRPALDEFVTYTHGTDNKGRVRATHATYVVARSQVRRDHRLSRPGQILSVLVSGTFLACVIVAITLGVLPSFLGAVYVLMSITAYVTYSSDKHAAQTVNWRSPEATLLLIGLVGGWPGALVAQHHLRHKNKKASFQIAYWFTVGLNCSALLWLRSL